MSEMLQRLCLTPMRNEAWIVRQFLAANSFWADRIVVADQGSTDGTLEELRRDPKVDLVINDSPKFDESHRQRILLDRARTTGGKRLLVGLDADEALSANCMRSKSWRKLNDARPGTIVRFRWVNILPGFQEAWIPPQPISCGFVDDGSNHEGRRIHSPRVPNPAGAPTIDLDDVVVLHFQYVLWERMASKQRWYQAWEYTKHQEKSPLEIFREYHHMRGSWGRGEIHPVQPQWLEGYEAQGISFRSLRCEPVTWWDREVAQLLCDHGPTHFRKLAIWDKNWDAFAKQVGLSAPALTDPRSAWEKAVHRLLIASQSRRSNWGVRAFERLLRATGW
jgi:hypothetical protein